MTGVGGKHIQFTLKTGVEATRTKYVPQLGEMLYVKDRRRTFIGDGATPGGIFLDNVHHELAYLRELDSCQAEEGDTCNVAEDASVRILIGSEWVRINGDDTVIQADKLWTTPALLSGWSNYNNGYAPIGYKKIAGSVHLQGLITRSNQSSETIFVLKEGYRPSRGSLLVTAMSNIGSVRLTIQSDGKVIAMTNSWLQWLAINDNFVV